MEFPFIAKYATQPISEILDKMEEERKELCEAIEQGDSEHIGEELMDYLQVGHTLRYRLELDGLLDSDVAYARHLEKLEERRRQGII